MFSLWFFSRALCLALFVGAYYLSRLRLRLFTSRGSTGRVAQHFLVCYSPLARIRGGGRGINAQLALL